MPVSLYTGEEEYLLSHSVTQLRARIVNPQLGQLSHKLLQKPSIDGVLEAVGAVSFNLGGKTLIEIQDFPYLSKAAETKGEEQQLAELQSLLETLDEGKHVLFVSAKINRRIKFAKWLSSQKFVEARDYEKLSPWKTDDAVLRLQQLAKEKGIQVDRQALMLLVENQGVELRPLINELEKLAVYASGRSVTVNDVKLLCNHSENAFRMLEDWVKDKARGPILQTLDEILLRQHPVALFALTQSYVSGLFQIRYWQQLGMSPQEMAERSKKHPYKIQMDLREFGSVPLTRLKKLKASTLDLEWKMKTGQVDARLAFEMLMGV